MENRQLIVNGVSLDFLSDDEPIPLILQANNIANITQLNGSGSKQFRLANTAKNRLTLGFPDDVTITTDQIYSQSNAKYIVEGIEVVQNGLLEVQYFKENAIECLLLFGNIDFLDKLGGQIYDMGDSTTQWTNYGQTLVFKPYDHYWTVSNAAYSQKKTSGWIWPIINYGDISTVAPFSGHINVRNIRPAFFLHTAIELLIQSTGYQIDYQQSCLYNDPIFANLYQKILIPYSSNDFEHGTDYQNTPDNLGASFTKGLDQVISNPRVPLQPDGYPFEGIITFQPGNVYTATQVVSFTAELVYNIYMRGKIGSSQPANVQIIFKVLPSGGVPTDFASNSHYLDQNSTRVNNGGDGANKTCEEEFINQKITQQITLNPGDQFYVDYHINNIGQGPYDTYAIFRHGATLNIVTSEKTVLWSQLIQCERILPNVGQIDFLKDTLQTFGLILISNPNNSKIIFTSFKTVVNNIPNALDWSTKLKDVGKQNNFRLDNYCQVNYLRYQYDSSIPINNMPMYFADDSIPIDDKTLNPNQITQTLFQSIYSPSINVPYIGGTMTQISSPTDTSEFAVGGQPRILIDQKVDLSSAGTGGNSLTVIFSDGDPGFETETIAINDVISVPYFYKIDAPNLGNNAASHLAWKDMPGLGNSVLKGLKSTYYTEFINILKKTKVIIGFFMLTPADIQDFDFRIPIFVYQFGGYFYVNKIDSWVKGIPTKVELIRL